MFVSFWWIISGAVLVCASVLATARYVRDVRRSADLFRAVAEGASDGLVLMEKDSRIVWANHAYYQIMGYPDGSLVGRYPLEFALPERLAMSQEEARSFRFNETDDRFGKLTQMENVRPNGTEFVHEFSHAAIHVGGSAKFLLTGRDITERLAREKALEAAQHKLRAQSLTDPLTGLSNRLHMQNRLEALTNGSTKFAVLLIDLDGMKQVNDTLGHNAGDALLRHVADAIRAEADPSWTCIRTGGDEFVVIIEDTDDLLLAMRTASKLSVSAAQKFAWESGYITARMSIGAAIWDDTALSIDELLNRADVALYEAKHRGKSTIVGYDESLHETFLASQSMTRDVAEAVRKRQFSFYFQPIVDINTCRVAKFEMLVRWKHPKQGLMSPHEFFPVIEQLGLANDLDRYVLVCAEKAIDRLNKAGLHHVNLTVNLSGTALSTNKMTELLVWLAECGRLDPNRITIEILESTALAIAEDDQPIRLLNALRDAGYNVYLDDFGMGYAGLAHLALLPANGLKIDRELTSGVEHDDASRTIVVTLVEMALKLGLDVVAEGVENMAQMDIIREAGCTQFQGYAVAKPMPLKRAIEWCLPEQEQGTGTVG